MSDIFETRSVKYNFRSQTDFAQPSSNLRHSGIHSLTFKAAKIWSMVPNDVENIKVVKFLFQY